MTDHPQYPKYPGEEGPGGQVPPPPNPPGQGQVPPPPPAYGQAPGYGQPPAYGQAPAYGQPPAYGQDWQKGPQGSYASWGARLGAYLLDGLIAFAIAIVPVVVGLVVLLAGATETTDIYGNTTLEDTNPLGVVIMGIGYLATFVFSIWNFVFRQGRTGQTLGKKIVGIKVIKERDGQPMGAGLAFGRYLLMAILSTLTCYINLLWPLWDDKKQALHDKVVSTVVVTAS